MDQPIAIDSLDDPRLAPYRQLKDRDLRQHDDRFIAESEHVVRRLLASDFPVESVLVCKRMANEIQLIMRPAVPLFVVPNDMISRVIGFKFHGGVLACGRCKPDVTLQQMIPALKERALIVACPEMGSHDNLGSLIRIAAAFGASGMLLGERCCDPFYRLCIRVSMGTIFSLPILRSTDFKTDLRWLHGQDFQLVGTVLDPAADELCNFYPAHRMVLLFGNEAQGLDSATAAMCDRLITIRMAEGIDSLNVAVAAGIFLYELRREQ